MTRHTTILPLLAAVVIACLAVATHAQVATPPLSPADAVSPSPSPALEVIRIKLDQDTREPVAHIGGRIYTSVDEVKAYVAALPRGTRVLYKPWLGPDNRHHKFIQPAIKELKQLCAEHGISFVVSIEPYW
jgi:hypothetical protein